MEATALKLTMADFWLTRDFKDIEGRYIGKLSDTAYLRAEGGQYGHFVRLHQRNTWIALSAKTWTFLRQNMNLISDAVDGKTNYSTTVCGNKEVIVSHYNGDTSVTFKENKTSAGKFSPKYISLNRNEWANFVTVAVAMDDCLKDIILYLGYGGDWHMLKHACGPSPGGYRLAPKLKDDVISLFLSAYIASQSVHQRVRQACIGYGITFDSHKQHHSDKCVCFATWPEKVAQHFDSVKDTVNVKRAVDKVNDVMNWNVPVTPITSDIRSLVEVEKVGSVVDAYVKLFDVIDVYGVAVK